MCRYKHHPPLQQQTNTESDNNRTFLKRTEIVGRDHDTKDRVVLYYFANLDHNFDF